MFDFEANEWRLNFGGGVQVIYNRKKSYLLLVGVGTDAPGAGDHLRVNVPPSDADETFDLHPHVTERRKHGVTRRPFRARLPLKTFVAFAEKASLAMREAWSAATQRVDLEELTEQGYGALDPTEEAKKDLCRVLFQQRGGEIRLAGFSNATTNYVLSFMEECLVDPIELEPERSAPGMYSVLRFSDDDFEFVGYLNWFPHGCGSDEEHREPGWYLTDVAKYQRESTRAFLEVGSDAFVDAMRAINVALGRGPELSDQAEAFLRQREAKILGASPATVAVDQPAALVDGQDEEPPSRARVEPRHHKHKEDRLGGQGEPLVPEVIIRRPRRRRADGHEGSASRPRGRDRNAPSARNIDTRPRRRAS